MPIIISTTRKDENSLKQLVQYVIKGEDESSVKTAIMFHNINLMSLDYRMISEAFVANDVFRKKRKGGIVLYHDIISFHPEDKNYLVENPQIIEDFVRTYFARRAPLGVGIAKAHIDKATLHIHVILSSVNKESSTSIRFSKKQFTQLKLYLDKYQLSKYPRLKHSYTSPLLDKENSRQRGL